MEPDARHTGGSRAPWLLREEGASHGFGAIDAFEPYLVNKKPRKWTHPPVL